MSSQNIQFPRFAPSSAPSSSLNMCEVDNLDVDLLAEYLLNDGQLNMASDVVFDFNLDTNTKGSAETSVVSPENSDEGSVRTDVPVAAAQINNGVATTANNVPIPPTLLYGAPFDTQPAPAPMTQPANQLPSLTPTIPNTNVAIAQPGANYTIQSQGNPAKRPRVIQNVPLMAVAPGIPNPMSVNPNAAALQAVANAIQNSTHPRAGRKKSQAQIDRRRERNRILARRTRLRKKFFFEALQKDVLELQRENRMLKQVVKSNIAGDAGQQILDSCDAFKKLPDGVLETCGENSAEYTGEDFNLVQSIKGSQHSFVITDPSLPDNPIVFASDDFLKLTKYNRDQVLGRNCRFLQGTDTCPEKVAAVKKCLATGDDVSVTMLNYTADGDPFWNKLFIAALRDAQNNIVNFIGVIAKVAGPAPGDPEYEAAKETTKAAEATAVAAKSAQEAADNIMDGVENLIGDGAGNQA